LRLFIFGEFTPGMPRVFEARKIAQDEPLSNRQINRCGITGKSIANNLLLIH
jgi:hypothetical protein